MGLPSTFRNPHTSYPLYSRAVQGHTPVLDVGLRIERAVYSREVAGSFPEADEIYHITWRRNAYSIARTGLQRRGRRGDLPLGG